MGGHNVWCAAGFNFRSTRFSLFINAPAGAMQPSKSDLHAGGTNVIISDCEINIVETALE